MSADDKFLINVPKAPEPPSPDVIELQKQVKELQRTNKNGTIAIGVSCFSVLVSGVIGISTWNEARHARIEAVQPFLEIQGYKQLNNKYNLGITAKNIGHTTARDVRSSWSMLLGRFRMPHNGDIKSTFELVHSESGGTMIRMGDLPSGGLFETSAFAFHPEWLKLQHPTWDTPDDTLVRLKGMIVYHDIAQREYSLSWCFEVFELFKRHDTETINWTPCIEQ